MLNFNGNYLCNLHRFEAQDCVLNYLKVLMLCCSMFTVWHAHLKKTLGFPRPSVTMIQERVIWWQNSEGCHKNGINSWFHYYQDTEFEALPQKWEHCKISLLQAQCVKQNFSKMCIFSRSSKSILICLRGPSITT